MSTAKIQSRNKYGGPFNNFPQAASNNFSNNFNGNSSNSNMNRSSLTNNHTSPSPSNRRTIQHSPNRGRIPPHFRNLNNFKANSGLNPNRLKNGNFMKTFQDERRENNRNLLRGKFNRYITPKEEKIDDDHEENKSSSKPNTSTNNNTTGFREWTNNETQLQERRELLVAMSECRNKNFEIRLKDYELLYKIPLLKYIYDIMGLVRIESYCSSTQKTVESENVELLLHLLPCGGGIFRNLWRHKQTPEKLHFLSQERDDGDRGMIHIPTEIRKLLTFARQRYATSCPQLPLPTQIKYQVNGIWETDIKIVCAFNRYLFNIKHQSGLPSCEYHVRVWSNGLIKIEDNDDKDEKETKYNPDEEDDDDDDDSDDDDDDDEEDPYQDYKEENTANDDEFYDPIKELEKIKIEDIIEQNQELNISKISRISFKKQRNERENKMQNNENKDNDDEKKKNEEIRKLNFMSDDYEIESIDADYEEIEDFVERVCESIAKASSGDAIMILIDTKNDPDIIVYVWKKKIVEYEEKDNMKIGDNHIDYRKEKYFDLNYNGKKINVGQYIGLSTCILNKYIHQFFSLFNTEIRFEPIQALELWPDFYYNQTLFEAKIEFEQENDNKLQAKYEKYYGKHLMNRLRNKKTRFTFDEMKEIEDRYNAEYFGNDEEDKESSPPKLKNHKEFKYHWRKAKEAWTVEQDILKKRFLEDDLTPRQFKIVKDHAIAKSFKDVPLDDDDRGTFNFVDINDNASHTTDNTMKNID